MKIKTRQKVRRGLVFFMFLMFPVILNYLSPVLILAGASKGIINGSLIVFTAMLISSLFFGRSYCGWLCPATGMQEATDRFRTKKAKTGWGNIVRWVIWLIWLGFIVYFFIKAQGISKVDFFYETPQIVSVMDPHMVIIYFAVVLLVFAMAMIWGQRAFCKYLCWMGSFMIIGDKIRHMLNIPGMYLKPHSDSCIECGRCNKECLMDIDVQKMVKQNDMYSSECVMCMKCVDVCPKSAISIKAGLK